MPSLKKKSETGGMGNISLIAARIIAVLSGNKKINQAKMSLPTRWHFFVQGLSIDEIIRHLAFFVSRLWQFHIFSEGNTRTTAVFFIKYLKTLGYDAANESFAGHAWHFRNALVRADYNDLKNGVCETTEYLELFLKNLLLDEENELSSRKLHITRQEGEAYEEI